MIKEELINIYAYIYIPSVFLKNGTVLFLPQEWDGKKRGPRSPNP